MGRKWIISVLADLRSFAELNDLPMLAAELSQASRVAEAELARVRDGLPRAAEGNGTRILSRDGGTGPRA